MTEAELKAYTYLSVSTLPIFLYYAIGYLRKKPVSQGVIKLSYYSSDGLRSI